MLLAPLLLLFFGGIAGWLAASIVVSAGWPGSMSAAHVTVAIERVRSVLGATARWLQKNPFAAVMLGLWVLFVPAAFPVFTWWSSWPYVWRIAVLVTWTGAAVAVGLAAFYRDKETKEALEALSEQRRRSSVVSGGILIKAVMASSPAGQVPSTLDVYLPSLERTRLELVASSRRDPREVRWVVGQGVTGASFLSKEQLIARRPHIHDGTFGLSSEDQAYYAETELQVIAATPILNAAGRAIGVLTLSSTEDSAYLNQPESLTDLLRLTVPLARVLIDVLGADTDEPYPGPPLRIEDRAELLRVTPIEEYSG